MFWTGNSYGQFDFNFPENVEIDPLNQDLKALGVKKIEQSYFSDDDSTSEVLEYVLEYDSLSNLCSFKLSFFEENFVIEPKQEIGGPILKNKIPEIGSHGNSKVYNFKKSSYAYAEYKFSWQSSYFKEIQYSHPTFSSKAPLGHSLMLNNSFKMTYPDSIRSTKLYADNRVYKEIIYVNDKVVELKEYAYKKITKDNKDYFLLSRITISEGDKSIIKIINYVF